METINRWVKKKKGVETFIVKGHYVNNMVCVVVTILFHVRTSDEVRVVMRCRCMW